MTDTTTTAPVREQHLTNTYTVYVYREMRLRFDGIQAESPEQAAEQAKDLSLKVADEIDECEGETLAALVDLDSDEQHEQSRTIDFEAGRMLKAEPKLLAALTALSGLEVKGHSLLARLQFTAEGRELAAQISEAIAEATEELPA
ncbi:hypothetical protein R5W24_000521 [Gemmata sp. JC717]|uniref:hypothetical protein n=1 Tax=Gemmata algarum TaxID=2975278 RepID=UPI0021BAB4E2|nr:hypothetical protein [Gemmata algarum]MDY3551445.1 hypothetical protein [Gemmata algarum]